MRSAVGTWEIAVKRKEEQSLPEFIFIKRHVVPSAEKSRAGKGTVDGPGRPGGEAEASVFKLVFKQRPKEVAEEACDWERSSQSHLGDCGVNCLMPRPASSVTPGLSHELLGVQPRLVTSLHWI